MFHIQVPDQRLSEETEWKHDWFNLIPWNHGPSNWKRPISPVSAWWSLASATSSSTTYHSSNAIALEPYRVAQRQYPDFRLNFDGIVRDPYNHQQGNAQPMIRTPQPSLRALPDPGGTIRPPMSRIPCPDLLAPEEPWYQHKPTADARGRDHSCSAWEHPWSLHREHQRGLQRECEMQGQVMPAATSLRHLALLERQQSYRQFVQKEQLRKIVALYGCMPWRVFGRCTCRALE